LKTYLFFILASPKNAAGAFLAVFFALSGWAQTDTTLKEKYLDEVIIYSNKFAERRKNIVQRIDVISKSQIARMNAQNTGDLLQNTGDVFVQKSQQGGSSPVIRGFEASRVLLVVDGIRMNNAIYRAGHLQNAITIDQNILESVEVLYGPASTLFGSDALGGVIHFRTKAPSLSLDEITRVIGSGFLRHSTVNNEKTGHIDLGLGGKKFGWLQSYNWSSFSDTKMGKNYHRKYPFFGRRSQYIATINGIDSIVQNPDDRIQRFSGYSQWDIVQKLLYKPGKRVSHELNLQYSGSSNLPRYDRLQDTRNDSLRYAEWYYGPQTRALAAYELNVEKAFFFDFVKSIVSYQHIKESRHQREYRRYDRLDNRIENVDVWGITIDGRLVRGNHELTTGIDGQWNGVTSTAHRLNIQTGTRSLLDSRYPDGSNRMGTFGLYVQHLLKLGEGKWVINDGLRVQLTSLHSTINNNTFFSFPFDEINQKHGAVTGNLGLAYMPSRTTRVNLGLATGFRSPNIDDAARIFESNTAAAQLIVPNPDIRPEYTYNIDLGIKQQLRPWLQLEATAYYTRFSNAIALFPFRLNDVDSTTYNGARVKIFSNQNVNKAFIYGFNAALTSHFAKGYLFTSALNYTRGRLTLPAGLQLPLDHIPPVFGKTSLSYTRSSLQVEFYALYNGWKKIKDYNPSGEDNAQYATPEGTPSWYTLNFKSTWTFNKKISLQAGIENALDRNYRNFASGFSAPGRNFMLALRSTFGN